MSNFVFKSFLEEVEKIFYRNQNLDEPEELIMGPISKKCQIMSGP
ncbi:hypothetical protein [Bacillus sp. OK048]|nr:hypothetical protein [Bacillus sp. OK048]